MSAEEALGDGWSRALHPDDRGRVLAEWERASAEGHDSVVEYRFLRPDGTVAWIQGFASPLYDDAGATIGWAGTCIDVSRRHRRDEQQELLVGFGLRALQASHADCLFDDALQTLAAGLGAPFAGFLEATGDGPLMLRASYGWELVDGTPVQALPTSPAGRALASGEPVLVEIAKDDQGWLRRVHGVRCSVAVPLTVGGSVLGVLTAHSVEPAAFDTSDLFFLKALANSVSAAVLRERAAEPVRQLAAIVGSSLDAIISRDVDGTVRTWNAAAEQLFGYTAEEMIGDSVARLHPAETRWKLHEINQRVARGEQISEHELTCLRKDGTQITVALTVSPICDEDGAIVGVSTIVRDVGARRALEEQLRQSQKLDAIGGLAGGIAHDFNNTLTAILGYTELLLRDPAPTRAQIHEKALGVRQAAGHAAALTRQLLAYSRKQTLAPEILDLNDVVADTRTMLERLIEENIEIELKQQGRLSLVEADRGQIGQVLTNLVVNARDAMPDGGKVTIETDNITLDAAGAARLVHAPAGDYVGLSVRDTGAGMAPDTLDRAFEPFFTTKAAGQGTGLGLSTVYGIVKQSNGYIYLTSSPGAGTSVDMYFPVVADASAKPRRIDRPGVEPGLGVPRRILLVEDNDTVRTVLARMLEENGHTVRAAATGDEALTLLDDDGGFDLAISDMMMPGITGAEFARRALTTHPDLRIILITGFSEHTLNGLARDPRIAVLAKPFSSDEISEAIQAALTAS